MASVNLGLILFKRLHIEGSTLRSRSLEYQADLIEKYMLELLIFPLLNLSSQVSIGCLLEDHRRRW